jgi:hypothetical protein
MGHEDAMISLRKVDLSKLKALREIALNTKEEVRYG